MTQMTTTDSLQVVSFSLVNHKNGKKEGYALPIDQVREIRTIDEITQVPKAKSYVKGIMNLRGVIIPVVDIKDKLGFGKTEITNKSKQRILVADINDSLCGILIDFVEQVMRIPQKDIGPAPTDAFEDYSYITGIAKTQGRLLVILDVKTLLSESELKQSPNPISTKKGLKPITPKINSVPDEDDIPPELKAVFDEDSAGIKPTEIKRESEIPTSHDGTNQLNDFQLRVNQESESYHGRS
jgi:purine-binding chemotaxis protein CheW